jgi:DNA repair protein RadC
VNTTKTSLQKIPVYEVRLVQSRRPLRLAETILTDSRTSARALHALIALTDREHFAALFVNGHHHVTGAHIVAIGAQHAIASIDVRAIFRAALAACASALVLGHSVPGNRMPLLLPTGICSPLFWGIDSEAYPSLWRPQNNETTPVSRPMA